MSIRIKNVYGVLLMIVVSISACGGGSGGGTSVSQDVVKACVSELVGKSVPEDIAGYFCSVKLASSCSSETSCRVTYTYPNGATREVTMTATPNRKYTPTADELANTAADAHPVYNAQFAATGLEVSTSADAVHADISYFLPTTSIQKSAAPALSASANGIRGVEMKAAGENDGYQINWSESGTKGADVAIGSILEHYKSLGLKSTGAAYGVASALSDISGAMALSKEINTWLDELDSLERCASDTTNPLTQSDPNYTATAVAQVHSARNSLKEISSVRFINIMDETAAGLHPVSAVLSIPLKQANIYVEQTLKGISESLMQDVRKAVVSCKPGCPTSLSATGVAESRIDVSWAAPTMSSGSSVVTNYILQGGNANGVSTADTMWPDIGLSPSTNYCYTVSAINDYGTSENCPQKCAQTMGPPVVNGTTPYAGSKNVPVNTTVTATFSEAMDPNTISTGTFTLSGSGAVAGTVSYTGNTATFTPTPSGSLEKGKLYTATVTTGVKDIDGVAMKENFTWSFTTEDSNAAYTGDITFTTSDGSTTAVGTGTVAWTLVNTTAGGDKFYLPSGTVTATFTHSNCSPVTKTISIDTQTNQGMGLIVYAPDSYFASKYHFRIYAGISPRAFATTMCNGTQTEIDTPVVFETMICNGAYTLTPYTTTTDFHGTYQCDDGTNVTNVSWNFAQ